MMVKFLLIPLIAIALIYMGVLVLAYVNQRRLQYFPTHRDANAKGGQGFVPWNDEKGNFLGYVRSADKPKRAILFFHGNGGEALDRSWVSEIDPEEQMVILLVEYPGYGAMKGQPKESALYEVAVNAWETATRRWKVPVTVMGESLGSGVATYLAKQKKVDRLALIAPLSSAADVAALHYSFLPVRLLIRDRFPTENHVKELQVPLHIVHGTMDDVVPIELGKKVLNAHSGNSKAMSEIPGYGHNNIHAAVIDSPFADTFRAFVRGEQP